MSTYRKPIRFIPEPSLSAETIEKIRSFMSTANSVWHYPIIEDDSDSIFVLDLTQDAAS